MLLNLVLPNIQEPGPMLTFDFDLYRMLPAFLQLTELSQDSETLLQSSHARLNYNYSDR